MTEHHDDARAATQRERELELEVGKLQAELATLRGEEPTTATSRFLAMAAATVDLAVADARREADEIVEEVSALAEARRDEAARVAAEAEALAERKLAEADRAQERIDEAGDEAETIRLAAEAEAAKVLADGRQKAEAETRALTDVREALETEREALESYHEQLRRRVHELAESMVAFMTTQPPLGTGSVLEHPVPAELEAVLAAEPELNRRAEDEPTAHEWHTEAGTDDDSAPDDGPTSDDRIVDVPDHSIDEIPDGPPAHFAGVPVIDDDHDEHDREHAHDVHAEFGADGALDPDGGDHASGDRPSSAGLFARATGGEGFAAFASPLERDAVLDSDSDGPVENESDAEPEPETSLFGALGPRLLQQTPPTDLAQALDLDDDVEDQAFRQFLDGDDEPDPSRDWLLRPEQH